MRTRLRTALVAADLALGDLDRAESDLAAIGAVGGPGGSASLRGALAYAAGDVERAGELFRSAPTDSRTSVVFR